MAAIHATPWPVSGQAFRFYFRIPVTGGLSALGAQISLDGAEFVGTQNSPVEILGSTGSGSGYGYLDLAAAETSCSSAVVRVFCSNAGGYEVSQQISPLALSPFASRWDAQSVLRLEQMFMDTFDFLWNQNNNTGALQQLYDRLGNLKASAVITEGDVTATRAKMS